MHSDKKKPTWIIFIVEGLSDQTVLEVPIGSIINELHPDEYHVRFVSPQQDVSSDDVDYDFGEEEIDYTKFIYEDEPVYGGDITSAVGVYPRNIERKIFEKCIRPLVRKNGIYPKRIQKIIQIVDTDGAFLPPENIINSIASRAIKKPYYNPKDGVIETNDIESIQKRNIRKRENICYLSSKESIAIESKTIPYEIYFFSSNMDHYINNNPNTSGDSKRTLADRFVRKYGLSTDTYTKFFFEDPNSIGYLGYKESWEEIQKHSNSVQRFTNIDFLLRKLLKGQI
jgi:hypothetical protein